MLREKTGSAERRHSEPVRRACVPQAGKQGWFTHRKLFFLLPPLCLFRDGGGGGGDGGGGCGGGSEGGGARGSRWPVVTSRGMQEELRPRDVTVDPCARDAAQAARAIRTALLW